MRIADEVQVAYHGGPLHGIIERAVGVTETSQIPTLIYSTIIFIPAFVGDRVGDRIEYEYRLRGRYDRDPLLWHYDFKSSERRACR